MTEYAIDVELAYYDTIFVEANSKEEAISKVIDNPQFSQDYKVLVRGKEQEFSNVEFMGIGDVVSE